MSEKQPDYSRWTLVHQVRDQAAKYGERVFMTFGDGAPALTYGAFDTRSDTVAAALTARGVAEGRQDDQRCRCKGRDVGGQQTSVWIVRPRGQQQSMTTLVSIESQAVCDQCQHGDRRCPGTERVPRGSRATQ